MVDELTLESGALEIEAAIERNAVDLLTEVQPLKLAPGERALPLELVRDPLVLVAPAGLEVEALDLAVHLGLEPRLARKGGRRDEQESAQREGPFHIPHAGR